MGVGMSYVDESQENASKEMKSDIPIEKDFFGDELRGYRLLKAARLSTQERQSILTLTGNSTRFEEIRRALRTLFADEANEESIKRKNVWWVDPELDQWNYENEELYADDYMDEWWTADESSYWTGGYEDDGNWDVGGDAYFEPWQSDGWDDSSPTPSDFVKEDTSDLGAIPEQERYEEAYTIATEAARTLKEARHAVAKVRAARGYYDVNGMKGAPKGAKGKNKGKSKGSSSGPGPCFRCGSPTPYLQPLPRSVFEPFGKSQWIAYEWWQIERQDVHQGQGQKRKVQAPGGLQLRLLRGRLPVCGHLERELPGGVHLRDVFAG